MDQQVPVPDAKSVGLIVLRLMVVIIPLSVEIKHIKQDVIRENVDRCRASTRLTCSGFSTNQHLNQRSRQSPGRTLRP
jgi:hypothetical protein